MYQGMYQRLGGKLIYLSHTRSDISYAVGVVSQFMHSPKNCHVEAIYRILQYLKLTSIKGILFKRNMDLNLEAYTDANWVRSVLKNRRST